MTSSKIVSVFFGCLVLAPALVPAVVQAAPSFPDLEKCYQAYGQIEETQAGGKKVTVYKDEAQVAAECNDKVLARAKKEKKTDTIVALAGVIGKNSNWQSSMPVFTVAAKADKTKEVCLGKDPLYALGAALAQPGDNKQAVDAVTFVNACWPKIKDRLVTMLGNADGYTKDNLCKVLKDKKALPANKASDCSG